MRNLFATPSRFFTTLLIIFVSVGLITGTVLAWKYANEFIRQRSEEHFNTSIRDIHFLLASRFNLYVSGLYSGKGLTESSDEVTRKEWHDFASTIDIPNRYPGLSSLGFHQIVTDKDKAAFLNSVRKDTSLDKTGYPNFVIYPEGKRDEYYVLKFIEPFTATSAAVIGYDYKTNDIRRAAEDEARSTGKPITSERFLAITTKRPTFIIALPVYKKNADLSTAEKRISAAEGFVVGGFNTEALFLNLFPTKNLYKGMDFHIYDSNEKQSGLLFDYTGTKNLTNVAFYRETDLQVPGKTWKVVFTAQEGYGLGPEIKIIPYLVLLTGILLSFLTIGTIFFLRSSQDKALTAAEVSEKKFKENEARYQLMFESLPDVFYQTDWKGVITEVSKSITQYTGLKREDVIGQKATDFYPVPAERKKLIAELIKKGKVNDYLITLKGKKGKLIKASLTGQIMYNSWKVPTGVQGILRDVTERQEREEELRKQKEELDIVRKNLETQNNLLEVLINNMPVGVYVFKAPKGEIMMINKPGQQMLGRDSKIEGTLTDDLKRYMSKHMIQKEDGSDYPVQEMPMAIAMKTKQASRKNDMIFVVKDKVKITLQVTAVPVLDQSKEVEFVVVVFEDITKEHQVDRMKTEFISLASHQLRTPLSAMRWYLEMLQDGDAGKLKPKQAEFITSVSESNLRLISLVNSLLNVSRIESGRIIIEPKETDLGKLLNSVLSDVKVAIEKKKQKAIISINSKFPTIVTDQSLLRNALMNLLTNAVKYTPEKGEITILASRKEKEIVIQISDTGYGIPQKEQMNVFTKFYRGSNILKKETDGNGLGMYLVKSVIDSLNGKITFESTEGEGTTFFVHLPIKGVKAKKGEVSLDS